MDLGLTLIRMVPLPFLVRVQGPAFSMGERPQDRRLEDGPGVGEYTLDSGKPNGPHYSMAGRPIVSGKEDEEVPGPGQYNQSLRVGDDGPAHTFGERLPDPRDEGVPGPGDDDVLYNA